MEFEQEKFKRIQKLEYSFPDEEKGEKITNYLHNSTYGVDLLWNEWSVFLTKLSPRKTNEESDLLKLVRINAQKGKKIKQVKFHQKYKNLLGVLHEGNFFELFDLE